jgi:hypothetical protein
MAPILILSLALAAAPADTADLPWQDLALSIEKDRSTSSDTATLCRVRVVNRGAHTWPGRQVRFEAAAIEAGVVMAREKGRFGLSLKPHDTLETVIAFDGLYDRFEVRPLVKGLDGGGSKSRGGGRGKSGKGAKKKRKSGGR